MIPATRPSHTLGTAVGARRGLFSMALVVAVLAGAPTGQSDRRPLDIPSTDPPGDTIIPSNPYVIDCGSGRADGDKMLFVIVDSRQGDSFSVEVLYGIAPPHPIRVAWSAQIPRTHEGVTTYFRKDSGFWEFHDFWNGLGGGCGQLVGHAGESSVYEVRVDFGGQDVESTSKHGYQHSRTVTLGVEGTFNVAVGAGFTGGSITVKYEDSNTWVVADEFIVTTHGYLKTFLQEYPNDLSSPKLWGCRQVLCEDVLASG